MTCPVVPASRNGNVTDRCVVCDGPLPPGRARTTCSDRCRQAAWRRRHQPPGLASPPLPAGRPRKPVTVYECPVCAARQLGEQYCSDCHSFMTRVGTGGMSPCCGEPITFDELIDTWELGS